MRVVRVTRVDASGMVSEWRHSFPQTLYEALEQQVTARFGYKPLTTAEIISTGGIALAAAAPHYCGAPRGSLPATPEAGARGRAVVHEAWVP